MREEPINKDVSWIDRILYVICTIICICFDIICIIIGCDEIGHDESFAIISLIIAIVIFIVTSLSIFERCVKKNSSLANVLIRALTIIILLIILATSYLVYTSTRCLTAKPIIYLYPEEETSIEIKLGYPEKITCSYPKYENSWKVTAYPDGTLIDSETGRSLYSLYWEGEGTAEYDMTEGFVVAKEDIVSFLEEKLVVLGLTEREAEEFIVYWIPRLQENKYNYIRFATLEEINEYMPLEFSTEPDTLIRVLMQYKALDKYIEVKEQKLEVKERKGFIAVEWGGTELR